MVNLPSNLGDGWNQATIWVQQHASGPRRGTGTAGWEASMEDSLLPARDAYWQHGESTVDKTVECWSRAVLEEQVGCGPR
jgi:hypothetical protein